MSGFANCAKPNIQFLNHGEERMSTNTTHRRGFYEKALLPMLALVILLGVGCSEKETTAQQEVMPTQAPAPQMAEPATPPVETTAPPVEAAAPAATAETQTAAADGQSIYKASCQACHAAGVAGAPKLGDKDAWAPRIAKGNDAMYLSLKNGLNAMPPKGACMSCSEDELRAAMEYMVEQGS
jgi:cytochrome c5